MARVQFFDGQTGLFTGIGFEGDEKDIAVNTPAGAVPIQAVPHPHATRLVDGAPVAYQPPPPDADHEWDGAAKRWRLSAAAEARNARRSAAQTEIDRLEKQQPRILRERDLGDMTVAEARQRLRAIDDQIIALRAIVNS